ncbi:MAG: hypothetical protein DHS80DRAFT_31956 [Piptocephalis tieghemiana]|nr:MAG: hypothetical protein DHS80DRAFT_31956 [Piptocephalis tieghemiana]
MFRLSHLGRPAQRLAQQVAHYSSSPVSATASSSLPSSVPGIKGFNKVILLGEVNSSPEPMQYSRGELHDLPGLQFSLRTRRSELDENGNEILMEDCHQIRCTDPKANRRLQHEMTVGSIVMIEGRLRYQQEKEGKPTSSTLVA